MKKSVLKWVKAGMWWCGVVGILLLEVRMAMGWFASGVRVQEIGWQGVGAHLGLSIIGAVLLTKWLGMRYQISRWVLGGYVFGMCVSMPVIGMLVVLCLGCMERWIVVLDDDFIDFDVGDPFDAREESSAKSGNVSKSILSVMSGVSVGDRRSAILAMREVADPSVVNLLERAIRDSDEHVRAYAQTMLTRLNEGFDERVRYAQEQLTESGLCEWNGVLASLGYERLQMGLVSVESRGEAFHEVIRLCNEGEGDDVNRVLRMVCCLESGRLDEAEEDVRVLKEHDYFSEDLEVGELELLSQKKDWDVFLARAREVYAHSGNGKILGVVQFFSEGRGSHV